MNFTHYWIAGFGWEDTMFLPTDFISIEEFGKGDGYVLFVAVNDLGGLHILKGNYQN